MKNPEKEGYYLCWIDVGLPEDAPPEWLIQEFKAGLWRSFSFSKDQGMRVLPIHNQSWVRHWQELPEPPKLDNP